MTQPTSFRRTRSLSGHANVFPPCWHYSHSYTVKTCWNPLPLKMIWRNYMRNGNYSAFYVAEPFNPSALGAHATRDFNYYNLLKSWKGLDPAFPFVDSHEKTYSVRDNSDWESTLKPRLRERLRASKNIILFLSDVTLNSTALREEIDYGINDQGLPIIVVYPSYSTKESLLINGKLKQEIKNLWSRLPIFRDSMDKVPTLHVPITKNEIAEALKNTDFMVSTKTTSDFYWFKP